MAVMWWIPLSCISGSSRVVAHATISGERFLRGALAELLDGRPLVVGAVAQPLEQRGVEPRLVRGEHEERHPQRALAGDPGQEALQLHHAAQRRVARELAVQLEPPGLLESPGGRD